MVDEISEVVNLDVEGEPRDVELMQAVRDVPRKVVRADSPVVVGLVEGKSTATERDAGSAQARLPSKTESTDEGWCTAG